MAIWIVAAALLGLLGVAMGAISAHGLPGDVDGLRRGWTETAVTYQMWHALALLAVALLAAHHGSRAGRSALTLAGFAFILGVLLFSGSLYLLAFAGWRGFAWVTPFGGLALLAGWAALAWYGLRLGRSLSTR